VTSLGLVQMTRKKVGLGLLETFSEACEVCAGRGVIVYHEPVSRKASSQGSGEKSNSRRKGKGAEKPVVEPHGIPQGAASALAQIAASTIGHAHDHDEQLHEVELETEGDTLDLNEALDSQDIFEESETIEILDIPVRSRGRKSRRASTDASSMLDSVLDALPDPKSPGEGRGRSRSV